MTDDAPRLGRIEKTASGWQGRIARHLGHPPAAVWALLTEPGGIAQWLAPGTIELRKGGRIHVDFGDSGVIIDSTLTEYDPPHLLAYSWSSGSDPERPLRWELTPAADGETDLTLTVGIPEGEDVAKACAGFEAHLLMLAAALEEVPIHFPFEVYQAARKGYQEMVAKA